MIWKVRTDAPAGLNFGRPSSSICIPSPSTSLGVCATTAVSPGCVDEAKESMRTSSSVDTEEKRKKKQSEPRKSGIRGRSKSITCDIFWNRFGDRPWFLESCWSRHIVCDVETEKTGFLFFSSWGVLCAGRDVSALAKSDAALEEGNFGQLLTDVHMAQVRCLA